MMARYSFTFLLLFLSCYAFSASIYYEDDGNLVIHFPDGGKMYATESFTIHFGNNGLIDTGSSITAYSQRETLTLNRGESLVFGDHGELNLGDLGNIQHTGFSINSEGEIIIDSFAESSTMLNLPSNVYTETLTTLSAHEYNKANDEECKFINNENDSRGGAIISTISTPEAFNNDLSNFQIIDKNNCSLSEDIINFNSPSEVISLAKPLIQESGDSSSQPVQTLITAVMESSILSFYFSCSLFASEHFHLPLNSFLKPIV